MQLQPTSKALHQQHKWKRGKSLLPEAVCSPTYLMGKDMPVYPHLEPQLVAFLHSVTTSQWLISMGFQSLICKLGLTPVPHLYSNLAIRCDRSGVRQKYQLS